MKQLHHETNRCIGKKVRVTGTGVEAKAVAGMVGEVVAYGACAHYDGKFVLLRLVAPNSHCHDAGGFTLDNSFTTLKDECYFVEADGVTLISAKPRARKNDSYRALVLSHLVSGKTLTQGEAILLGFGMRLAVTIDRLRGEGHKIQTTMKTDSNGHQYGEYKLVVRNRFGDRKAA